MSHHRGVLRFDDLLAGFDERLADQRSAAKLASAAALQTDPNPRGQISTRVSNATRWTSTFGKTGKDRRQDRALHHRIDHRTGLIDHDNQSRWVRFYWRCGDSQSVDIQTLFIGIPVGEVFPQRLFQIEFRNTRLGECCDRSLPLLAFLTLQFQHVSELIDIRADQLWHFPAPHRTGSTCRPKLFHKCNGRRQLAAGASL